MSDVNMEFLGHVVLLLVKLFGDKRGSSDDYNKIAELLSEIERFYKALPDLKEAME